MVCLKGWGLVFLMLFLLLLPAMADGVSYSVPVSVTVNPLYTLSLDIRLMEKTVRPGEKLDALLEVRKTGGKGAIEVGLDYWIMRGEEAVSSGCIGQVSLENYMLKWARIPVPASLEPGRYTLKVTASHPQAYPASDTDDFRVIRKCAWWEFWCWLW